MGGINIIGLLNCIQPKTNWSSKTNWPVIGPHPYSNGGNNNDPFVASSSLQNDLEESLHYWDQIDPRQRRFQIEG